MPPSVVTDPVTTIRAEARQMQSRPLSARLWRSLSDRWLRPQEHHLTYELRRLDHPGVQDDYRAALQR